MDDKIVGPKVETLQTVLELGKENYEMLLNGVEKLYGSTQTKFPDGAGHFLPITH